jgi:putative serine protease PepD
VAGAGLLLLTGAGDSTNHHHDRDRGDDRRRGAALRRLRRPRRAHAVRQRQPRRGRHHLARHLVLRRWRLALRGPGQSGSTATGTGFVVDGKGHIVTARTSSTAASSISVKFQDGTTRTAKVLGTDNATDVAVLAVDPSGLTLHPLRLGSSASLSIGDEVAAIGDPFTYDRSLSTGVVSGLDRTISAPNGFTVAHAIQTDAALNPATRAAPCSTRAAGSSASSTRSPPTAPRRRARASASRSRSTLVRSELSKLETGQTVRHAYLGVSTSDLGTGSAGALSPERGEQRPRRERRPALGRRRHRSTARRRSRARTTSSRRSRRTARAIACQVTVKRGSSTQTVTVTLGTQPTQVAQSGQTP